MRYADRDTAIGPRNICMMRRVIEATDCFAFAGCSTESDFRHADKSGQMTVPTNYNDDFQAGMVVVAKVVFVDRNT